MLDIDGPLALKAESYLHHMMLAAKVGDRSSGFWRTMLDNWNCYSRGHPFVASDGKGQPHWFNRARAAKHGDALLAMHRRSILADEIIRLVKGDPLAVDHVVPVNVLRDMMIELAPSWSDVEQVRGFLARWYRLCVLTVDEHALLNSKQFHTGRLDEQSLFERYSLAGIPLVEA